MPALVTTVVIEVPIAAAVVSTGVCELKVILDCEPVVDVLVAAAATT
jgi:hypothetical protein